MNRTELTILLAVVFVLAVLLGWVLRWMFSRINRAGLEARSQSNEMAERLHAAEEARDEARRDRDDAIADMQNRLRETEAELRAAMEGLGEARRQSEDLRARLEGNA